jgi:hypothetical protein
MIIIFAKNKGVVLVIKTLPKSGDFGELDKYNFYNLSFLLPRLLFQVLLHAVLYHSCN